VTVVTTRYNNENLIDGPADLLLAVGDMGHLATHHSTACTTTVLTMVSDPTATGWRVGDVIKVATGGTEARMITAITDATVTVAPAFTAAPAIDVDIYRIGVGVGYTDQGVRLATKTSYKDREADQSLEPISTKPEKRESTIKATLQEILGLSAQAALNLPTAAVTVSGSRTTIKVGNLSIAMTTFGLMALGLMENGKKVTVWASRCVNQGESGFEFSKGKASGFAFDAKILADSTQGAGAEAYTVDIDTDYHLEYLL
jgi:hypothetical protein